ncbi:MAG: hypothetical protein OQL19_21865 [Gammaproteobacteria bacterium]|nr:hypothetical protein [Gammaproteobacteria bacterium]
MKQQELQAIYQSLDDYELKILQQSKEDFELSENIRFTNLQAYINHLALSVREKQLNGEFVPRNHEEAQAGYYL